MSEKRFTLAYADYDWWAICDKENPTELGISGEDVVELLNELYEENQDLKSFNKDLAENLSVCANARISKDDWIETLTEENEQLKKDREELFIRERDTKNEWRELKQENEQLKQDIEYYKIERLALFEYLDKKDDLKLELKVEK